MFQWMKQLALWTTICSVSAAPSFVLAFAAFDGPNQVLTMMAGVACFIIGYTAVSMTAWAQRLRRRPFVATTMKIGYGTRITLSVLTACAAGGPGSTIIMPDLWIGAWCMHWVQFLLHFGEGTLEMVFATTIVVGVVWNVILAVYMLLIQATQRMFRRKPPPSGMCANCGYDLRASVGQCPECGTAIQASASSKDAAHA